MTTHAADEALSVRDPIRIVPLHVPESTTRAFDVEGLAPASPTQLTYRGGPLLTAVKVFTVYWGAAWSTPALADMATKIDGFFQFVLTSTLMDQMGEYSVPGKTIGHGSWVGRALVTKPVPKHVVTDAGIQKMLKAEFASSSAGFPQPDANTLYFVYTPPGTTIVQGGSRSCQAFCGYHSDISGHTFYAAMPYPGCNGCTGGLAPFDALTSTSSHELCEAVTDPVPGSGWYDDVHGEIGDICAWKTKKLGGYTVQLEWSNTASACQ